MKQPKVLAARRPGPRPADRQEPGALLPQADLGERRSVTNLARMPLSQLPSVDGVLSAAQVADSAASIAAMQEPCGAVPWTVGEHVDIWNHVEAAMALLVGGQVEAAEHAYAWVPTIQRADGSWPMKIVNGAADDERGEVNMSAYLAVGIWHHWLVQRDLRFVQRFWPSVRAGLDWVVSQQLPFGGIQWTPTEEFALLAGSSSIYQSLRAGRRARRAARRPAAGVGAGRRPARPRRTRAPRPVRGQVDLLDGLVLPGPGRPGPRPSGLRPAGVALGRVRRARPRHPLRRHQPVGDRRRDLRARHGARHDRRPPSRADAAQGHAAPARVRRPVLDRLGLRRRSRRASRATSTGRSSTRPTPPPR